MYVRGIEAIKQYMPQDNSEISANIKEERGLELSATDKMSSAERYSEEWDNLLKYLDHDPEYIREQAFESDLKVSKFRSLYWALLLRVLNTDYHSWSEQREKQRKRYEKLKDEFIKDPHAITVADDNPLSQSAKSVWNQYFSDQELFGVISQDVIRTFPGVDFFRKKIIQNAMSNILFYYAREHPYMCYRQGMHEILAPILFVLYGDQQSLLHFAEISHSPTSEVLLNVLDPNYLEADSYSLFSRLMSSIESYYRINNFVQPLNDSRISPDSDSNQALGTGAEVISQLNSIREKILAKEDLHLHNYLLKLDIPLHIFGIRWLRLLFGREFALLDLLVIWDAIFADSDHFDLPNYILVAMLIRIRDKLLMSDQTTCLTLLMRYPTNVDVHLILRHALHMLKPKKFERPINAFVYFTTNKKTSGNSAKTTVNKASTQDARISSGTFMETESSSKQQNYVPNSTADSFSKMEQQITKLQTQNAADAAAISRFRKDAPEETSAIAEGYSKNSQELVNLELKNAQTVISIARSKLQTYVATIKNQLPGNSSKELMQALDGIDELCSFLDVKFMFPIHATRPPIDEALEANEQVNLRKGRWKKENKNGSKTTTNIGSNQDQSVESRKRLANADALSESPMTSINTYERPEENGLLSPTHLLRGIREIELLTIAQTEYVVEPTDVSQPTSESNQEVDPKSSNTISQKTAT